MANFFEKVKDVVTEKAGVVTKKAGEVFDTVAKKTEQTVEVQKIKSKISTMERSNEKDYKEIGKIIYDRFKKGEGVDGEFVELCDAIAEREAEIAKAKEEIAGLKGLDVCPKCASHIEPEAKFCPRCGWKVEEASAEAETEE